MVESSHNLVFLKDLKMTHICPGNLSRKNCNIGASSTGKGFVLPHTLHIPTELPEWRDQSPSSILILQIPEESHVFLSNALHRRIFFIY